MERNELNSKNYIMLKNATNNMKGIVLNEL